MRYLTALGQTKRILKIKNKLNVTQNATEIAYITL